VECSSELRPEASAKLDLKVYCYYSLKFIVVFNFFSSLIHITLPMIL
jgi:hypothetical protein